MNIKSYLTPERRVSLICNAFYVGVIALFAVALVAGTMLQLKPIETRPQSALVPTLQYLTTADLNDLRTAMFNHSAQIADLRAANKGLAAELAARIEPLEAAMKSMQTTTGSIPSKGKR